MPKLTVEEIVKMCDRLKYKYPQHGMREDLKYEAITAVYNRLDTHPEEHPAYLYNIARSAMFDYANFKSRVVVVPANTTSRAVAGDRRIPKRSHYSTEGLLALQNALQPSMEYGDTVVETTEDCSKSYEDNDFITKGMELLSEKYADVIKLRYFEGKTQDEVSHIYGVSRQAIALWEREALDSMSKV